MHVCLKHRRCDLPTQIFLRPLSMANRKNCVVLVLFSILAICTGNSIIKNSDTLESCEVPINNFPKGSLKLFVFGDSYVDTGNLLRARFSDGCVLTDFIASSFGIHSPVLYTDKDSIENQPELQYGMNFALAGSGVFQEIGVVRNMTSQINNFVEQIDRKVYAEHDLENSVGLLSNAGNDYGRYVKSHGNFQGIKDFVREVVHQLAANAKEIHQLGIKKVAIFGSPPTGCLPQYNAKPRVYCNESWNEVSKFHNNQLQKAVRELNKETMEDTFIYLELYNPFISIINERRGTPTYQNPLVPCCNGVTEEFNCGSVDKYGTPLFTECNNPKLSTVWDMGHPSHSASYAIYLTLLPSLSKLC